MLKTIMLAIVSVIIATAGQLLLRSGMVRIGYVGAEQLRNPLILTGRVMGEPLVLAGLSAFVVSAAFWLLVLSRVPLSFAYPFAGLTYLLVAGFDSLLLRERVPGLRWLGIMLIVTGIIVVGRTAPPGIE